MKQRAPGSESLYGVLSRAAGAQGFVRQRGNLVSGPFAHLDLRSAMSESASQRYAESPMHRSASPCLSHQALGPLRPISDVLR